MRYYAHYNDTGKLIAIGTGNGGGISGRQDSKHSPDTIPTAQTRRQPYQGRDTHKLQWQY